MNNKKICFITCVNDLELYDECVKYLSNLNVPEGYEVENIFIEEAESITKAYNEAMKASDARYKVYMHQDVFVINKNFIFDILNIFQNDKNVGLLGVIGAKAIPTSGLWQDSGSKYGKVYDSHTSKMELTCFDEVDKDYESVKVIDGLIMATQYDIPWCEEKFDGWSFYDLSQSMEFIKAGYKVAIPKQEKPWVIHDCGLANVEKEYQHYCEEFLKEYAKDLFPLVSILIPTYNRPEYFKLALESILNQTYRNIEIIIGDDSINTETEDLVRKNYLKKYSNIKYYHNKKNMGQFDNDLKLFDMANGEFINFLMDDDLFEATKVQKMMEYFIQDTTEEISLVTSHRAVIDEIGRIKGIYGKTDELFNSSSILDGIQLGNFMLKFYFNCIGEPTTVLFRKKSLKEPFGTFNGRRYGCSVDMASWFNLLSQKKAIFINDTLSYFRIHSGQQQHELKIMLKGFADFIYALLNCREKGFLEDTYEYLEALDRFVNLHSKNMIETLKNNESVISGCVEYEEFIKLYSILLESYETYKKQTEIDKVACKTSSATYEVSAADLNCNSLDDTKEFPLVSILIPAYNQTKYLKDALESAINQTYPNIEIIIGDDSTTNEVNEFVQSYLNQYSNITYYKNVRTGMDYGVSNVEGLFERSNGEYINYLFHDDIFHVTKIEKMMQCFLQQDNVSLVTSHRQLIDEVGQLLPDNVATKRIFDKDTLVSGKRLSLICLENLANFIGEPTTVLFKKSFLNEGFGRFNGKSYTNIGDMAMWFSLLQKGDAVYLRESLSYFRQHSSQNSQKPEIYFMGVIEWQNILINCHKTGLIASPQVYKELVAKWFYTFNHVIKMVAFNAFEHNLKGQLKEAFQNAIEILISDEKYAHECVICGKELDKFLPYNVAIPESMDKYDIIGSDTKNFSCPHCYSHDRERHLVMFFDKLNIWDSIRNKKVLHIAPEMRLKQIIKQVGPEEYVQGDLYPADESITRVDITNISFADEYFDLVICNHVLEHIEADGKAMSELYRVLKKGGYAILQTPYSPVLQKSYEDNSIKSDEQRLEKFGQVDHVRIFGLDLFTRLERAGFVPNVIKNDDLFSEEECKKYGVNSRENLILVNKK
jgi:glycosyltransferase involved in cell wall biosynthesis